jgi:hypothetical protein
MLAESLRSTVGSVNQTAEGVRTMVDVVREFGGALDSSVVSVAVPGVLFLSWVIASRRRTRHLAELVRAMRRPR